MVRTCQKRFTVHDLNILVPRSKVRTRKILQKITICSPACKTIRFKSQLYLSLSFVKALSCLEGTASKPPKQDNCATKRHAPFSFSLEPKQVGKPKMSITDMTGHMECMVVSECLWDDCILSTPPSGSIPYLVASINLPSCSRTDGKVTDA